MYRSICGVIALLVACAATANAQDGELFEAIHAAVDTHPRLQQERASLRAAREAIPLALAPYRPQLTFQASTARSDRTAILSDGQAIDDETSPSTYTLDAQQIIWSAGRRDLALRRSILSVRVAEARYAAIEQSIALETATTYLDLVRAHEVHAFQGDAVRALTHILTATTRRYERGQATRTEIAQAAARLAGAQAEFAGTSAEMSTLYARFERLTGYRPEELHWPSLHIDIETLDHATDLAREYSHELAQARLEAQIAHTDLMIATRRNGPTLSLGLQRSESDNVSPAVVADDETQVNLTLSVPLLTGGERAARRRQALASRTSARHGVRDIEAEVSLQTTQLWGQIEADGIALDAQSERVSAAELALEGVERGHEAGLWSLIDTLDATEQLLQARQDRSEALRNMYAAQFRLMLMTDSQL